MCNSSDWIEYWLYCHLIYVCCCLKVRTGLWVSVSRCSCILSLVWPGTLYIDCIIWVLGFGHHQTVGNSIDWSDYFLYCQLIYVCCYLNVKTGLWTSVSLCVCILILVWPGTICIHCIIWVLVFGHHQTVGNSFDWSDYCLYCQLIYTCCCSGVGTSMWVSVSLSGYILMLDWPAAVYTDVTWVWFWASAINKRLKATGLMESVFLLSLAALVFSKAKQHWQIMMFYKFNTIRQNPWQMVFNQWDLLPSF